MGNLTTNSAPQNTWSLVNDDFDNLFEGFFRPMRARETSPMVPAMDITERENEYVIRTEMPGVSKDAIDITLAEGVLTICGECKYEQDAREGDRVLRQERRYGKFARSVRLGTQINEKAVKANYKDGILELTLPKAEEVKPKKIAVA